MILGPLYALALAPCTCTCLLTKGQNVCTSWGKSAQRFRSYARSKLAPKMKMTIWATPRPICRKNYQILRPLQESLSQMMDLLTTTDGHLQLRGIWKKMTWYAQKIVKKWVQNHDFCHMIANISKNVGLIDTKFGIIIHGINLLVYIKYRVASFTLKVYKFFFFFTKKLIILLKFMCRRMHDFGHSICPK